MGAFHRLWRCDIFRGRCRLNRVWFFMLMYIEKYNHRNMWTIEAEEIRKKKTNWWWLCCMAPCEIWHVLSKEHIFRFGVGGSPLTNDLHLGHHPPLEDVAMCRRVWFVETNPCESTSALNHTLCQWHGNLWQPWCWGAHGGVVVTQILDELVMSNAYMQILKT